MRHLINPTIGCKKKNQFKYLTYKKKPKNEVDFGLLKRRYLRFYYKCNLCGHLVARHKKELFDQLYDKIYFESTYKSKKQLSKIFTKISKLPKSKSDNFHRVKRIKKMIKILFKKQKISILDIGSGTGIFPIKIMSKMYDVTSIEPSKACTDFIKKKSNLKIKVFNSDFLKIKINKLKKYNLITFNKVLEHVEQPLIFLKKSLKLLKKDNLIYVEVPDIKAIHDKKEGKEREEFGLGHHHVFSKKSLENVFKISKINLISIESIRETSGKYTVYAFGSKK